MSIWDYMTTPMGQSMNQHPLAQQMMGGQQGFAAQTNPLFWAGLGMLANSGPGPQGSSVSRTVQGALSGMQMGQGMARQEQAQQLEWAKLQAAMESSSLQSQKLRMEIDEARRQRANARKAAEIMGTSPAITGERQEGPPQRGQLPPGLEGVPGTGFLGGEYTATQAGSLLGALGPDYSGMARDLIKQGQPLDPKDRFVSGPKGSLWDVSDPRSPRHIPVPGMGGVGGPGNIYENAGVKTALSGITEADYRPESVAAFMQAVQNGDPSAHSQLKRWGVYEGPNLTPQVVDKFIERFEDNTATAKEGASSVKKMMMALNEPGGITDVATLYGFIKAIDPGSVVREGEVAIVREAQGAIENLKSLLQRNIANKGFLTPKMRQQLSGIGENLMQHYEESYNSMRGHYEKEIVPRMGGASSAMMLGPQYSFSAPPLDPQFQGNPTANAASAGSPTPVPGPQAPPEGMTSEQYLRMQELERKERENFIQRGDYPGRVR